MNDAKSFVMAQRLRGLRERRGLSHVRLAQEIAEKYGVNISKDSLINYEVSDEFHQKAFANDGMRVSTLRTLADFYNVSTDYLLGVSGVSTPDESVQGAIRATGLNEKALIAVSEATNTICNGLPIRGALNELLCSPLLKQVLYEFSQYKLSCYHLSSLKKSETPQEFSADIAEHDERQKKDVAALHLQRLLFKMLDDIEKQGDKKWQD